jgi:myo-inositol-1(or 4)-monophosphatase
MKPTADFFKQAQACLEKVVRDYRHQLLTAFGDVAHEIKEDNSPVTKLDLELELLMKDSLKKLDSGIGFEGEEHGKEGNDKTFWLIDPIDGTANFIRGIPFVFNMATLIDNDEPVYAFVYRFIPDELFIAKKGGGAYKNNQPIKVSDRPLDKAWIEIDTTYFGRPEAIPLIQAVESKIHRLRKIDDFTFVPQGRVDGHIVYKAGGKVWDYPPRALLISEAGGRVANIGSDTYHYRDLSLLATNPLIFDDLKQAINLAIGS